MKNSQTTLRQAPRPARWAGRGGQGERGTPFVLSRSKHERSNVLVSGGTGFLGSATGQALEQAGYPHQLLDARSSGNGLEAILSAIPETERTQATLIHLAGLSDARVAQEDPGRAIDEVVRLTLQTVDLCVRFKLAKCILVSSATVYGQQRRQPVSEASSLNPQGIYAAAKAAAEWMARGRVAGESLALDIVRPGNILGPQMHERTVVKEILAQLRSRRHPVTVQSLRPRRDYIHVKDVARALVALLSSASEKEPVRVFNIGTGRGTSALELYRLLAQILGIPAEDPVETAPEEIRTFDLILDTASLRQATGWRPKISLEESLRELVQRE